MGQVKLSLVVATVERSTEVRTLLQGFVEQPFREFEVILVDQNKDDRLLPIVREFESKLPLRHMRLAIKNCSGARNAGLMAASGMYIGFPDDDCQYKPDTMTRVIAHFDSNEQLVLLGGPCVSPEGHFINGRWTPHSCEITETNVWTTICGFSMWMRTAPTQEVGGFDPKIGPGTQWGSGEEPDLGIRLLRKGYKGYYDTALGIRHPNKTLTPHAIQRAFLYGAGMGRVMQKHSMRLRSVFPYFIRPVGGMLVSLLRGNLAHMRYYRDTLRGRIFGYRSGSIA